MSFMILFQLGINSGGNTAAWNSALVIGSLTAAAVCFALLVTWELIFAVNPVTPVRVLTRTSVGCACLCFWFSSASYFTNQFHVPLYLQVLGYSTTATGLRFIPQAAGIAIGSIFFGYLITKLNKTFALNILTQLLLVAACALFASMMVLTPAWCSFIYLGINGLGQGGLYSTMLMAFLSIIDRDEQTAVTASIGVHSCYWTDCGPHDLVGLVSRRSSQ